jgi:Xaa-Pro aminopeptidase
VIQKAGYGKMFNHALGHGLGLVAHEVPRIGKGTQTVLEPGMVITIEPGIYLPGVGGVRLEDDVLVTKSGYEVLSSLPVEFS